MMSLLAVLLVLAALFVLSLLVERVLHRSRIEMVKPGWFVVCCFVFVPGAALVYNLVSLESPWLYAAYGAAGGAAALVAQCFYGVKLKPTRRA